MNQEDYKEIAKIMEYHIKENDNDLKHPSMTKERHDDVTRFIETICHQLADYFEKKEELQKILSKKEKLSTNKEFEEYWEKEHFNREQFLKDCGVE